MRPMIPDTRSIRITRLTARATVHGDRLGVKDSEKETRKFPFSDKQDARV